MADRYIIVSQVTTKLGVPGLWHIAKRGIGRRPVYHIVATTKSERSAQELLEALLSTPANKE